MSPLSNRCNSTFHPTASMAGTALVVLTATVVAMFFLSRGGNLSSIGTTVCGGIGAAALTGFAIASVVAMRAQSKNRDSLTPTSASTPPPIPSSHSAFSRPGSSGAARAEPKRSSVTPSASGSTIPTKLATTSGRASLTTTKNTFRSVASSSSSDSPDGDEFATPETSPQPQTDPVPVPVTDPTPVPATLTDPAPVTDPVPVTVLPNSDNTSTPPPASSANGAPAHTPKFTKVPAHPDQLTKDEQDHTLLNTLIKAVVDGSPKIKTQIKELSDAIMNVFAALASKKNCQKYQLNPIEDAYVDNMKTFLAFFAEKCFTPELFIWGPLIKSTSSIAELIKTAIEYTKNTSALRLTTYTIPSTGLWGKLKAGVLDWKLHGPLTDINKTLHPSLSDDEFKGIFPFVSSLIIQYRTENSPLMALFQEHLNACREQFAALHEKEHEFVDFSAQSIAIANAQVQALIEKINTN